jgi:hypothetical protein
MTNAGHRLRTELSTLRPCWKRARATAATFDERTQTISGWDVDRKLFDPGRNVLTDGRLRSSMTCTYVARQGSVPSQRSRAR